MQKIIAVRSLQRVENKYLNLKKIFKFRRDLKRIEVCMHRKPNLYYLFAKKSSHNKVDTKGTLNSAPKLSKFSLSIYIPTPKWTKVSQKDKAFPGKLYHHSPEVTKRRRSRWKLLQTHTHTATEKSDLSPMIGLSSFLSSLDDISILVAPLLQN